MNLGKTGWYLATYSISSLFKPTPANTTMGKPGKCTVLVKLETQVVECLEQQW